MAAKLPLSTKIYPMLLIYAATLLIGCTSLRQDKITVREYLDSKTGSTITAASQLIVLYSEEPLLAVNSRDYISIGPVEINKAGKRSYLLWIGIWTTIDRPTMSTETLHQQFDPIHFLIDGEPMEFSLIPRSGIVEAPYKLSSPGLSEGYYAITRNQIERFAEATDLRVRVPVNETSSKIYRLWQTDTGSFAQFASFLHDAGM